MIMTIANRLRGTYGWFAKVVGITLGVLAYLVTGEWLLGVLVAVGYVVGESFGRGDWIGTISERVHKVKPEPYEEGKNNGIQWIAAKVVDPDTNWLNHCRVALAIRGLYWWTLALGVLVVATWWVVPAVIVLAIGFPLAAELGYKSQNWWSLKMMSGGWEHQEVWYGLMQDIILIGVVLCLG